MKYRYYWSFQCDCGAVVERDYSKITCGDVQSCGCLRRENITRVSLTHGLSHLPEYRIWKAMRSRCNNPNAQFFADYGGRGITVCTRWQDFAAFYADMGPRPSPAHSIDRIDNDGPYCPENCRWATKSWQRKNSRSGRIIEVGGRSMNVSDWATETGIPASTISLRLKNGWSPERAVTTPLRPAAGVCSLPGCTEKHHAGGFCSRHYLQLVRHGSITE